jgi:transcriptional regulator with XRE-family HTH domain
MALSPSFSIGDKIILALESVNKTPAALAKFLKTQPSTVYGWCRNGKIPAADRILPICEFTGVTPAFLLSGATSESDVFSEQEINALNFVRNLESRNFPLNNFDDALNIAHRWMALDDDGRTIVKNKIIEEERLAAESKEKEALA